MSSGVFAGDEGEVGRRFPGVRPSCTAALSAKEVSCLRHGVGARPGGRTQSRGPRMFAATVRCAESVSER